MTSHEIQTRIEAKAYNYGVNAAVATLLGEYCAELLKDAETPTACEQAVNDDDEPMPWDEENVDVDDTTNEELLKTLKAIALRADIHNILSSRR